MPSATTAPAVYGNYARRCRLSTAARHRRERRLRLLFIDAGFPKPTTQIPVVDERGRLVKVFDWGYLPLAGEGWDDFKLAAEYDGDQHRTNRKRYVKDLRALPKVQRMGWIVIRAIEEDREEDFVDRAWQAMGSRGWKPQRRSERRIPPKRTLCRPPLELSLQYVGLGGTSAVVTPIALPWRRQRRPCSARGLRPSLGRSS